MAIRQSVGMKFDENENNFPSEDRLRFTSTFEHHRHIDHITIRGARKIRTKLIIVMDPRETLILSLKREISALQLENEHLKSALHLHSEFKGSWTNVESAKGRCRKSISIRVDRFNFHQF